MYRKHVLLKVFVGLLGLALFASCGLVRRTVMPTFQQAITETPAPTAKPLPSATPMPSATSIPQAPTATPEYTSTPESTDGEIPDTTSTVVVPPDETINLPEGFGISVFSEGLLNPRMMTVGPDGALYVAERGAQRIVRLPDRDGDGVSDGVEVVAEAGLQSPSSLAFYEDGSLYVGDTTRVLRFYPPENDVTDLWTEWEVIVDGLPTGGHTTRTVLFSLDYETLFVSIGSSCNVCVEDDQRRATIMRYNPDGSDGAIYADGLRNAVGITFRPGTEELWATNNGRDWLGDDQPPETVYRITEPGTDAGWPRCHAARILDPDFGEEGDCEGVLAPIVEMQAHSAPLGLGFYTGEQFPAQYRGDLFVAFHGSWNRTVPTGYKVVRIPLEDGEAGEVEDFAVGWLRDDGSNWGRPVDVMTGPEGSLFVSDDGEGKIYRIFALGVQSALSN